MVNCVVFLAVIVFGVCVCAPPPRVSKHFRADYKYNRDTDAFYKLHVDTRRGSKANAVCQVEGASLMLPVNHADVIQAHAMFKRYPDLGQYLWVAKDGREHESAEEPAIINLSSDGSESEEGRGSCEALTRDGEIEDLPCYRQIPFICKVDAKDTPYDSQCDVYANDYHYNASVGSCYSIRRWLATWDEGYAECRGEGAHLVVLNSQLEMEVVHNLMKTTPRVEGGRNPWYYNAGFRAEKPVGDETREFKTIFNETLESAGYTDWTPPEPNNLGGDEYCGSLFVPDGKLNDVTCSDLYAFICEKEVPAQP